MSMQSQASAPAPSHTTQVDWEQVKSWLLQHGWSNSYTFFGEGGWSHVERSRRYFLHAAAPALAHELGCRPRIFREGEKWLVSAVDSDGLGWLERGFGEEQDAIDYAANLIEALDLGGDD